MSDTNTPRNEIGNMIRSERKKAKLTQIQLSELSGITQTYLSQIEGGTKEPTISTLKNIAAGLKMKLNVNFTNHE